jgi:hypothetical protein
VWLGQHAETILSVVIGATIGAAINWWFAWRSGRELSTEAVRLRRMVNTLARALQEAGVIDASFDDTSERELRGLNLKRTLGGGQIAPRGELQVTVQRGSGVSPGAGAQGQAEGERAPKSDA